ncbi:2OG-Fe(II) oxygenase family protein [Rhizoctonia solani 123E]|uniref:2OG-Fe(II) oxygenase family protein n=1 Tax=Rhizoctonia solani 123E TaxID=1423351 RepID=A0A074S5J9_9AGAM|nr:2OG-Fe(II) oxygenase family protein [Rhizoctonia solani 123E]
MEHLNEYQVDRHPVHYIPNFINEAEEATLLRKIESSPAGKWRNLPNRRQLRSRVRLQVWGGEISKSGTLVPQDLPSFVTDYPNLLEKLRATGAFSAVSQGTVNHIILNEYLPGQGITPHQDGPSYHPVVATLTLGSHAVMEYYRYRESSQDGSDDPNREDVGKTIDPLPTLRLLLEPRSLVITHGALYTQHLHGIPGVHCDIFAPPHESLNTLQTRYAGEEGRTQVVFARDIANREMLGSQDLRDRFAQLASSTESVDQEGKHNKLIYLARQTRVSLTCRVVEKSSKAAGKLLKQR